ncbi:MAG: ABC transporter ATP-binding protein [candidate division KSB1 bacterium]|nr:ABC transporter ATP-binding protein [candidate division KSB1 bacterium]MDZ7311432.1 ABC transporter ATP-binding protein [candidate division KSB1 bacterium]
MIHIKNLSKAFASVQALRDVSFSVEKGTLCGLVGPNGAGKSTLFKILMGLLKPDTGELALAGVQITYGDVAYKRKIGYAPETEILYEYLTGLEFLQFIAAAKQVAPIKREEQIRSWLAFFDLSRKANELITHYSHGMRRKISLCAALLGTPEILLLDEATNGLDAESSFRLKEYLREFCGHGGTVLFSSHIIETVEHLCDRLVILHEGRILREMQRQEWGDLRRQGSSLEQEFMAMVRDR